MSSRAKDVIKSFNYANKKIKNIIEQVTKSEKIQRTS